MLHPIALDLENRDRVIVQRDLAASWTSYSSAVAKSLRVSASDGE